MSIRSAQNFHVENILGLKMENQNLWYLIKWQGFSDQYNSWEPIENFDDLHFLKQKDNSFKKQVGKVLQKKYDAWLSKEYLSPEDLKVGTAKDLETYESDADEIMKNIYKESSIQLISPEKTKKKRKSRASKKKKISKKKKVIKKKKIKKKSKKKLKKLKKLKKKRYNEGDTKSSIKQTSSEEGQNVKKIIRLFSDESSAKEDSDNFETSENFSTDYKVDKEISYRKKTEPKRSNKKKKYSNFEDKFTIKLSQDTTKNISRKSNSSKKRNKKIVSDDDYRIKLKKNSKHVYQTAKKKEKPYLIKKRSQSEKKTFKFLEPKSKTRNIKIPFLFSETSFEYDPKEAANDKAKKKNFLLDKFEKKSNKKEEKKKRQSNNQNSFKSKNIEKDSIINFLLRDNFGSDISNSSIFPQSEQIKEENQYASSNENISKNTFDIFGNTPCVFNQICNEKDTPRESNVSIPLFVKPVRKDMFTSERKPNFNQTYLFPKIFNFKKEKNKSFYNQEKVFFDSPEKKRPKKGSTNFPNSYKLINRSKFNIQHEDPYLRKQAIDNFNKNKDLESNLQGIPYLIPKKKGKFSKFNISNRFYSNRKREDQIFFNKPFF